MALHQFISVSSFDPETIEILNMAFDAACVDLGVTDKTPHSRENVAKTVIMFADGRRNPALIREAVVSFLRSRH